MNYIFAERLYFNGNISNWDVGNVTNMSSMFSQATSFNGNISNWNVGNVTHMNYMFDTAIKFNQDISNWDVRNVTNMSGMFSGATSFNGNISNWNVGNVTAMGGMFENASSFNGNISNWDVGNVTNMTGMFSGATSFNGNISNWNVGNVTKMDYMFNGATSFNGNISNWDVGNVTNMTGMFQGVTYFIDMSNQIHSNGTPYNYFISQINTTISVSIRTYSLVKFSNSNGTVLTLIDKFDPKEHSDANRILNALSITSMEDLVNYSFTSSEDSTSRNIESIWVINRFDTSTHYKYNVSGPHTNEYYDISDRLYTLYFTRRTGL